MCGIAGVVTFRGPAPARSVLEAMAESLRHRGPDAGGAARDETGAPFVALVHRRLSIIDLSAQAEQPISNEDGRVQVVLNGEI